MKQKHYNFLRNVWKRLVRKWAHTHFYSISVTTTCDTKPRCPTTIVVFISYSSEEKECLLLNDRVVTFLFCPRRIILKRKLHVHSMYSFRSIDNIVTILKPYISAQKSELMEQQVNKLSASLVKPVFTDYLCRKSENKNNTYSVFAFKEIHCFFLII